MEIQVSEKDFEEKVINSKVPVLVDFYADWCGPCKMLAPVLANIDKAFGGKLVIAKCNIDENMELSSTYRVSSIPNMLLFKDGVVVTGIIGFVHENELKTKIEKEIN